MSTTLRLFMLEDDPFDADLIIATLEEAGYRCEWERVETRAAFLAGLDAPDYDLILADYNLPAFDGLTALQLFLERDMGLPFILVSGSLGEETAIESLRAGATDYVLKDRLSRLGPVVQRALREKEEQQRLKQAEAEITRLATVIEQATVTIVVTDLEWNIVYANPAFETNTGYTVAEALGQKSHILQSGQQDAQFYQELWDTVAAGNAWTGVFINKRKDGGLYNEKATIFPVQDLAGEIVNYATVKQDITERVQAEEALRESEERFRQIAENIRELFWITDPKTKKLLYISPAYEEMWGRPCESAYERQEVWFEDIHPKDRDRVLATLERQSQGYPTVAEYRIVRPDGSIRWIQDRAFPIKDAQGQLDGITGVVRDITERKQAQESLRQRHRDLAMLHRAGQALTSTLDLDQVLATVLEELRDLLNVTSSSAWLMDPETDELVCRQASGLQSEGVIGWRLPPGEGIAGWVARSGESLIVPNAQADERHFVEVDQQTGLGLRSILCIPLCVKQTVIGVLQAVDMAVDRFAPDDLTLAEQLAVTAAIAIENARLYEQARHEIAERKRAEEGQRKALAEALQATHALRENEERMRQVIENMPVMMDAFDAERNTIVWNQECERVTGYSADEIIGNPKATELLYPDTAYRERMIVAWAERGNDHRDWEWQMACKDGSVKMVAWSNISARFPIRGWATWGIGVDVTERVQAEKERGQYIERLRILRAIDGAILAARAPEEIARSALRHMRQLVPCWRASVVMFDENEREGNVLATFTGGETQIGTGTHYALEPSTIEDLKQGKVHVVEDVLSLPQPAPVIQTLHAEGLRSYITVPLIAQGKPVGSLNLGAQSPGAFAPEHVDIAREVADQVAMGLSQAQLREQIERHVEELEQRVAERTADLSVANAELARAARLKDEFLAAMSHELRTPLNAILGLSEALQEEVYGSLNERQIKSLHTIETSGHHLLALINDILDVSKVEAGKLELTVGPVSVEAVCQASLGLVKQTAHKKRIKVSSSFDSAVTTIQADVRRLKQVLVNLLSNAIKFTHEGGAIGLEVVGDAEREALHFTVWDTGIGIAPEEMKRLFQPFVQLDSSLSRRHAGTGLGLVLVHRMVEMHGGGVSVESEAGKGSRFTVSLPWRPGDDTGTRGQGDEGSDHLSLDLPVSVSPRHPITILLAEDNEANIYTILEYLQALGYRVIVARNGTEAVERAIEERPDLIMMDVQMPEMDGLEATRRIRSSPPSSPPPAGGRKGGKELADVPIIALTALAMPGDRERCLEAGMNGYLSKPVGLKSLVHAIGTQLSVGRELG